MDILYIALIIGALLGGIISIVFEIYGRKASRSAIYSLFGMSLSDIIFGGMVIVIVGCFVFLATASAVVRDLAYPNSKPLNFTFETLMMAFLPAVVFLFMAPLRGYKITGSTIEEFFILVAKFGLLHILLQFSGTYSNIFPPK